MSEKVFDAVEAVRLRTGEATSRRPGGLYDIEGRCAEAEVAESGLSGRLMLAAVCKEGVAEVEVGVGSSSASNGDTS